ncbi:PIN domain-containing protein [Azospirillum thermophilum]|uniref:Ribonuclease VapC n=1 Tax=Azospirillum thermophilum TaxID=2202148 RepID=A0A2S2CQT3_9PROT|nr:PIN domain-containing protein [Azospirillum thermophilum]AWK86842.1 hypothetical protein DEW08_11905 [Azospirillum thermophilum]
MKVMFDSNILLYAYDHSGEFHRTASRDLLKRALSRDSVLTLQSLGEFYWVAKRKQRATEDRIARALANLRRMFPVVAADEECFDAAVSVARDHGIPFWDALLWATAQKAGCDVLFSEDYQDGRKLGRVTIVDPFKIENRDFLDVALPPVE